jgi:integral membrane protein
MDLLKTYRLVSVFEGVSLLVLFCIAMPLKYIFNAPLMVEIVGMAHGLLFIAYVIFSVIYKFKVNWNFSQIAIVLLASIVPFGTFYIDKKYLKTIS